MTRTKTSKTPAQLDAEIAASLAGKSREATPDITIAWYAVPNDNTSRGGFMPVYERNGKRHGNAYGRGYDKDEAERLAEVLAHDEAEHYVGDWNVVVRKGYP